MYNQDSNVVNFTHVRWRTICTPNNTFTYYAQIEESIEEYQIDDPVFMSGNVYKQQGNECVVPSLNDTTDCICSVKSTGLWKGFVDIITEIDAENNCITFATHGDYLFNHLISFDSDWNKYSTQYGYFLPSFRNHILHLNKTFDKIELIFVY